MDHSNPEWDAWLIKGSELNSIYTPDELKHAEDLRKQTCSMLMELGTQLRLPQHTMATALVYFHRFFIKKRLQDGDPDMIGITCLFLASKVEETPLRLQELISNFFLLRHKRESKSEEEIQVRDSILYKTEFELLKAIGFDFAVECPFRFVLGYIKLLHGNKTLAKNAWNLAANSLRTTLCLQYEPRKIAVASIYLALKFLKHNLPDPRMYWWEIFDVQAEELLDIANQILSLYRTLPTYESIKSSVESDAITFRDRHSQIEKDNRPSRENTPVKSSSSSRKYGWSNSSRYDYRYRSPERNTRHSPYRGPSPSPPRGRYNQPPPRGRSPGYYREPRSYRQQWSPRETHFNRSPPRDRYHSPRSRSPPMSPPQSPNTKRSPSPRGRSRSPKRVKPSAEQGWKNSRNPPPRDMRPQRGSWYQPNYYSNRYY